MRHFRLPPWFLVSAAALAVLACSTPQPPDAARHRWWSGLGPVLPHDTFPTDCKLCHEGESWTQIRRDFQFDHEKQTGVPLGGAHAQARCLHCHNDRGPVATFAAQGCAGCHEDVHEGYLSRDCTTCHGEQTWYPSGMAVAHSRTRMPLVGAHATAACNRCHPGAFVGRFTPTDAECTTCHQVDLQHAINPPHIGLGWTADCNRCHIPTSWHQARPN